MRTAKARFTIKKDGMDVAILYIDSIHGGFDTSVLDIKVKENTYEAVTEIVLEV
jgi:hypothetical protein